MHKNEIKELKEFLSLARALKDAMRTSIEIDTENVWKCSSYFEYIRKYNLLIKRIRQKIELKTIFDLYDLEKIPNNFDINAIQQKSLFDSVYSNLSILESFLTNNIGEKDDKISESQKVSLTPITWDDYYDLTKGCI